MILRLSQDQVFFLHASLIQRFGGAQGILDLHLLNSALAAPYQTFDGDLLFFINRGTGCETRLWFNSKSSIS